MKKIAVLGDDKFSLGFELAGIKNSFKLSRDHPEETINELMSNDDIGLVIVEEKVLDGLNEQLREKMLQSIEPVFLMISQQDTNEELKKLIKKSIGVDLWDK
ncbi:MAG: V-type ATP synthase subunit F [Candidatus Woesearchaeota archaeon]